MPDSIRLQVLNAFAARLGAAFGTGEEGPYDNRETVIVPGDEESSRDAYEIQRPTMAVLAVRYEPLRSSVWAGPQAEGILAALVKEATAGDRTLGGLCQDILYTGGGPEYPGAGGEFVGARATFEITYAFPEGDPFTNALMEVL